MREAKSPDLAIHLEQVAAIREGIQVHLQEFDPTFRHLRETVAIVGPALTEGT